MAKLRKPRAPGVQVHKDCKRLVKLDWLPACAKCKDTGMILQRFAPPCDRGARLVPCPVCTLDEA